MTKDTIFKILNFNSINNDNIKNTDFAIHISCFMSHNQLDLCEDVFCSNLFNLLASVSDDHEQNLKRR